uniref:Uncharacterized protein n=1 Tax=viral metagenome TaxID=1070528 RepID=A0A6C0CFS1_9ZZZZ
MGCCLRKPVQTDEVVTVLPPEPEVKETPPEQSALFKKIESNPLA